MRTTRWREGVLRGRLRVWSDRSRVYTRIDALFFKTNTMVGTRVLKINASKCARGVLVKDTSGLAPRSAFLGST